MAKVQVTPEVVETRKVVVKEEEVTLTLTKEEALILSCALGAMSCGIQSPIYHALSDAGFDGEQINKAKLVVPYCSGARSVERRS